MRAQKGMTEMNFYGTPLVVSYNYWEGRPATYEQPADPEEYEIDDVTVGGFSILDLLSREQLRDIAERLLVR